jgi:hypothetical protein
MARPTEFELAVAIQVDTQVPMTGRMPGWRWSARSQLPVKAPNGYHIAVPGCHAD